MKTVLITLISGICVCLATASELKKDSNAFNQNVEASTVFDVHKNFESKENNNILFENIFGKPEYTHIIKIEDIHIYEIEETVHLNFNTKDYLPVDFNPYQGMNSKDELEFETQIAFEAVFGKTEAKAPIINIEDIVLYDIDETI